MFLHPESCSLGAWPCHVCRRADGAVCHNGRGYASSFRRAAVPRHGHGWGCGLSLESFVSPRPRLGAAPVPNTFLPRMPPPASPSSAPWAGGRAAAAPPFPCPPPLPSPAPRPPASLSALFQDGRRRLCDRPGHVVPLFVRSQGLGRRRLSLPTRRPEASTALVNRSLSDHGNGLGRGARGSGSGGGSLVAARGGGAAAAAVAVALAPALSAMQRGGSERELAAEWEAAAAGPVRVDPGASGEPERKAREERAAALAPAQPRAAEEGDARLLRRPPSTPPKLAPARGLGPLGKSRSKGRGGKRSLGRRSDGYYSVRPVTVDSSKARTSLDALKISIRQLQWREVRRPRVGRARAVGGSPALTLAPLQLWSPPVPHFVDTCLYVWLLH